MLDYPHAGHVEGVVGLQWVDRNGLVDVLCCLVEVAREVVVVVLCEEVVHAEFPVEGDVFLGGSLLLFVRSVRAAIRLCAAIGCWLFLQIALHKVDDRLLLFGVGVQLLDVGEGAGNTLPEHLSQVLVGVLSEHITLQEVQRYPSCSISALVLVGLFLVQLDELLLVLLLGLVEA